MKRLGTLGLVLALIAAAAGGLAAQAVSATIPAELFRKPAGPFAIGTVEWLWIDQSRPEVYTKDPTDRRHLPIRVWYPADVPQGAEPALYVRAPAEFGPQSPLKSVEHVRTNAVADAPVATARKKYPVLLYNPGAGSTRFGATFLTELLASHGYIVIGIEHPGMGPTVRFTDGTSFAMDTLTLPNPDPKNPGPGVRQVLESLDTVAFPIWLADSRYVLDRLADLDREPGPFHGRLDLDRIGMLGWSFGGAAALEMLRTDPRVKAAIDHDGRQFGGMMKDPVLSRPFLMFHHAVDDISKAPEANRPMMREMEALIGGLDSTVRARATGDWYDVRIARTNHGHFADVALYYKVFEDTALTTGRRGHDIIGAYTLAFFDRYLGGKKSPLLEGPSADFPEVQFRKR